jgi:arginase
MTDLRQPTRYRPTAAIGSGKAVGFEITIYNPTLDTDGSAGRRLVDTLSRALGSSAPTK